MQYFFECSDNLKEWNASFKSKTDSTSHLELPNTEMYHYIVDMPGCSLQTSHLCLQSVTTHLSFVSFLLISITGLKYAEKPSFSIPK